MSPLEVMSSRIEYYQVAIQEQTQKLRGRDMRNSDEPLIFWMVSFSCPLMSFLLSYFSFAFLNGILIF